MSEGIFGKYNVEVSDIKLGGIFQVLSAKIYDRFVDLMLPRPAG